MNFKNLEILLVDDAPFSKKMIIGDLIALGIDQEKIKQVSNTKEALSILEHFKPDLVITNGDMLTINSVALAKELKHDSKFSNIPIIFLWAQNYIKKLCHDADIKAFFFPIDADKNELKHIINQAIKR